MARTKRAATRDRAVNVQATSRRQGAAVRQSVRRRAWREFALRMLTLGQRALVVALSLAVLVVFIVGIVEQRWKEDALRAEVDARAVELRAAEGRNQELREQLAATNPDAYRAYVEDTARRQLNLGYPDETVVLVNWHDSPGSSPAPTATVTLTPTPTGSR